MDNNGEILTSDLVKKARLKQGFTQSKFAIFLGKAQSEVSKYERGTVDPPGSVIIRCMHILREDRTEETAPSIDDIIEKLKAGFDAPNHAMARSLIMGIILNEDNKGV
jgi:transcriptional regulator with XRE-family HTH domain